ncbi:MAG TPA: hypothetical protein VJH03_17145 [Blastocatellia bacterium]|nr:hypothetical protein [Blastocatellia bacterium]
MIEIRETLEFLTARAVEFIIIGGVAANIHGSTQATFDLDICYARNARNLERLGLALIDIHATLRNAPPDLPFRPDAETLRRGLNFTFNTDLGTLDLLGEVAGVGTFEDIVGACQTTELFGKHYSVISLPHLISAKRAAGRAKDLSALPELEAILEYQRNDQAT